VEDNKGVMKAENGGTGWLEGRRVEPDGTQGAQSVWLPESTDGDGVDKMIICNYVHIWYRQVIRDTTRNPLNRRVSNGTHGGVGGRLPK
jgi:hypothetical protein